MIKNYIIVTLRNLGKNTLFVIMNIVGLALALAISITAFLNNKYNSDWDKFHENYDDIYKVSIYRDMENRQQDYGITPFILGELLEKDIPGVEQIVRTVRSYSPIKYGENIFSKSIEYVDPNFMEVFTIDILSGNTNALKDKGNILISDRLAEIYFGTDDPVGKIISVFDDQNTETTFTVAGVFKGFPQNSSFFTEAITHIENYVDMWEVEYNDWNHWVNGTFLLLKDKSKIPEIEKILENYLPVQNEARPDFLITSFFIEPLEVVPDNGRGRWAHRYRSNFHPAAVIAPPVMAILILIIACFNFTNSSISFAGKRLKEIGLRKVFGGHRQHIVIQFLSENFIITLLSIILGIFLATFLVPMYSSMWEYMDLEFTFRNNLPLVIFLVLLLFGTTLLAGAYPSFYISSFNSIKIFRERLKLSGRNRLSKILLGFQFSISVVGLVAGVMFTQNAYFQENFFLGYEKDNILILSTNNNSDYKPLEEVVRTMPEVESFAGTSYHIGFGRYNRNVKFEDKEVESTVMHIGKGYLETMGVKILEGREFDLEHEGTDINDHSIIVNEKFVKDFGLKDPIGKSMLMQDTLNMRIIGVMNDFYPYGLWMPVEPLLMRVTEEEHYTRIALRVHSDNMHKVNEQLKEAWAELIPNYPYEGMYQEELMEEAKEINTNIKQMFVFLAIIACFMSGVGLFTLVSLSIQGRVKEIGVRKVMGASVGIIMRIINKPFIILILIAAIIGCGLGYYLSIMLMDSVWNIHTNANAISFIIPIAMILGIAASTITWKVYRAALQNPATSLRYE